MAVVTADGRTLRAVPEGGRRRVKGTVCLLQGRAESSRNTSRRWRTCAGAASPWWHSTGAVRRLAARDRQSAQRPCPRLRPLRRDLEAVRDSLLEPIMPKPHFALAHSWAARWRSYGPWEGVLPFQRLVALTPMLALSMVKHRGPQSSWRGPSTRSATRRLRTRAARTRSPRRHSRATASRPTPALRPKCTGGGGARLRRDRRPDGGLAQRGLPLHGAFQRGRFPLQVRCRRSSSRRVADRSAPPRQSSVSRRA